MEHFKLQGTIKSDEEVDDDMGIDNLISGGKKMMFMNTQKIPSTKNAS
jgi:hypothetical protein